MKITQTQPDIFDVTSSICDFRAHIFYPQTTQELPKKHYGAGPPEQLPTDALSQIDYRHTRHCKDCKEVCLCQRTIFFVILITLLNIAIIKYYKIQTQDININTNTKSRLIQRIPK